MPNGWMKLLLHPRHPKVLKLAALTGTNNRDMFCMVIDWLWYVNDHFTGPRTDMTVDEFHAACGFVEGKVGLAQAMEDRGVNWVRIENGRIVIVDFQKHFSDNAKRRAKGALRASRFRHAGGVTKRAPTAEQRTAAAETDTAVDKSGSAAVASHAGRNGSAAAVGSDPVGVRRRMFSPDGQTVYQLLRAIWPDEEATVRELASHPNATLARVSWLVETATAKVQAGKMRRGVAGIGGHVRRGIERGWNPPVRGGA